MSRRMWQRGPDGEIVRAPARSSEREDRSADSPDAPRRAALKLALRLGFRDLYDYLGSLVLLSTLLTFLSFAAAGAGHSLGLTLFGRLPGALPPLLSIPVGVAGWVLVGAPLTGGLYRFARRAAARDEPELFDLAWGFRRGFRKSAGLGAAQAGVILVLGGNCLFYLAQRNLVLMALGATVGYLLLFWLAAMLYQWPLMLEQEIGPLAAVRKSALLVLDNAPFTFGLLGVIGLVAALLGVTVVGLVLILPGALAMLTTQATRELLRKYGLLPPDPTLDPMAAEEQV